MKFRIFSVYDKKAEMFMRPLFVRAAGEATRMFIDVVGDAESVLGKNPEDYDLHEIGEWDDNSAMFTDLPSTQVITGLEAYAAGRQPKPADRLIGDANG